MLLCHVTCVGIIASLCRDQRLSPAITAAPQNCQHPIFVCCSDSADRRVTDNNVITVCCYNRYNHIIFRVQTHNVCRNQQTTVAVIIGCTRRHVSTWRYSTLSHEAAGAGQRGCCQNHAMQISSPGAALLLAFIMEMSRHPDHGQQRSSGESEKCTDIYLVVCSCLKTNEQLFKYSHYVTACDPYQTRRQLCGELVPMQ